MDILLFMLGILGFIVSTLVLVINLFRKKPKKNALIALGTSVLVFVISFAITPGGNSIDIETSKVEKNEVVEKEPKEIEEEEGLITVEQVPYEITILEPNSIGVVYMEATYTNNTDYPITSIRLKTLLKDKNETGYLGTHDTVLPGETSPVFDGFGPETMKEEDYEIIEVIVRAEKDNGETLTMEYDPKLDKYEYMEY